MTRSRAVLYVRLSESTEESTSVARQEADLRARAEADGLEVVEVLVDDGISGRRSRERADRALAMIRSREADVLMVWKFDRWSRQGLGVLAALIETLDATPGSKALFLKDGLDTDQSAWRIIAAVLAEVARMEAEGISLRVRSSIAALRTSGRFSGGVVPFGYASVPNPDGPGVVLVVEPTEAAVLTEIAERVAAGTSPGKVAADLNARGLRPRRADAWTRFAVRSVLTSAASVGRVTHHGEVLRGAHGLPLQVWEPALDPALWHRVRALLDGSAGVAPPARRRAARLLSGVLFCGSCDRPLYVRDGRAGPSYRCMAKANGQPCEGVSVQGLAVERFVEAEFLGIIGRFEVPALQVDEDLETAASLLDTEEALDRVMAALRTVEDEDDEIALLAQRRTLRARLLALQGAASRPASRLVGSGTTYAQKWHSGDIDTRRALLLGALDSIVVRKGRPGPKTLDPARFEFHWNPDGTPEE